MWIFGDKLVAASFEKYFKAPVEEDNQGYMKSTFAVTGFMSTSFTHYDQNTISRLRNVMAKAISDKWLFPKWIVIVMDDSIIRSLKLCSSRATDCYTKILENIMKEHDKYVTIQKEILPKHSQRKKYATNSVD